MKNKELKKFFPAAFVFIFVAFSFVVANSFGNTYAVEEITEEEAAAYCPAGYEYYGGAELYYGGKVICCPSTKSSEHGLATDNFIMTSASDVCYMNINAHAATDKCDDAGLYKLSVIYDQGNQASKYECTATPKIFEIEGYYYVTLKLNGDGGTVKNTRTETNAGSSYPAVNYFEYDNWYAEKDGYFFKGWTTTGDCSFPKTSGRYEFDSSGSMTLTACYVKGVYVTFHNDAGKEISKVLVEPGEDIPEDQLPDIINPSAYGGNGWWSTSSSSCDDKYAFAVLNRDVESDMDLYPCYGEPTDDDLNGDPDSGDDEEDDDDSGSGSSGGSSSGGSGTGSSGSGNKDDSDEETYILTLHTDGGDLYYNDREYSKKSFELSSFNYNDFYAEKSGFNFVGWDTDDSCDVPVDSRKKTLTKDMDLYACYEKKSTSDGNTGNSNNGNDNTNDDNNSDVEQNPNTGSFMLYVVFLIGILSLGYTGYSVFKYLNNN